MSRYTIDWSSYEWDQSREGIFTWPKGVAVRFPNGDVYEWDGAYDKDGQSIDYDPDGTGAMASPCGQALLAHGLIARN